MTENLNYNFEEFSVNTLEKELNENKNKGKTDKTRKHSTKKIKKLYTEEDKEKYRSLFFKMNGEKQDKVDIKKVIPKAKKAETNETDLYDICRTFKIRNYAQKTKPDIIKEIYKDVYKIRGENEEEEEEEEENQDIEEKTEKKFELPKEKGERFKLEKELYTISLKLGIKLDEKEVEKLSLDEIKELLDSYAEKLTDHINEDVTTNINVSEFAVGTLQLTGGLMESLSPSIFDNLENDIIKDKKILQEILDKSLEDPNSRVGNTLKKNLSPDKLFYIMMLKIVGCNAYNNLKKNRME